MSIRGGLAELIGRQTKPLDAKIDSDEDDAPPLQTQALYLFDAAFNVAAQRPNEAETADCFANLLEAMLPGSEDLVEQIKSIALLLSGELAPELSRLFAPVLVRARH